MNNDIVLVDCTLRDGGYYNSWDFSLDLVQDYLHAMAALAVDYVELGFRSFKNDGFKGAFAYTTDSFVSTLSIPVGLKLGVMVNAAELAGYEYGPKKALERLFSPASESPIRLVRLATHYVDLPAAMNAVEWLKERGYTVGVNLMQVSELSAEELKRAGELAQQYGPDVLYFADSMGSLLPEYLGQILGQLKGSWAGAIGIHAHDNLGNALACTLQSLDRGVTWMDSTVTGMGRGPGNTKTEYLAIELNERRNTKGDVTALLSLIRKHFTPLQAHYGWGTNPYYYLAGKYGIHPTYVQEMLSDARYNDEDILAVIQHLQQVGASSYDAPTLEAGRHFYSGKPHGEWQPDSMIKGREVLILGAGPSVSAHLTALEQYMRTCRPFVIALNTVDVIAPELVSIRAACHPVRLLADCEHYAGHEQPLATPASMLPQAVREALNGVNLFDFGLAVEPGRFSFHSNHCIIPSALVVAYGLAIATSGQATRILLAGFDGYSADDPRRTEVDALFHLYAQASDIPFAAVTPTKYEIPNLSIYAL